MSERAAARWKTSDWRGYPNFECTVGSCQFKTLDKGEIILHAKHQHPLASEGAAPEELSPLRGVNFQTDRAAEQAIEAGLSARDFDSITPTGATGGFTVADVREAAKASTQR